MWGYSIDRPFATRCASAISATTVKRLRLRWFFNSRDVVTATPAVAHGSVYVGDWSGRFYALRAHDGKPRWTFTAPPEQLVYSGQIVGSAAVRDGGRCPHRLRAVGQDRVHAASGRRQEAVAAQRGQEGSRR